MTQPTTIDELGRKNEMLKAIEAEAQKCVNATEYYDELITGDWTKLPLHTKAAINSIGNKILDIIHNG